MPQSVSDHGPGPVASDIDFGTQTYFEAPWRSLRSIAEVDPIYWSDRLQGWVVTRHADVKAGYADRRLSAERMELYLRALPGDPRARYPDLVKYHTINVAFMDHPSHLRVRTLMMKTFSRRQIDNLRPAIIGIITDVLDEAERLGTFDLVEVVSAQVPARVIQAILGVPGSMTVEFFSLATTIMRAMGSVQPTADAMRDANEAFVTLNQIFRRLIAQRREEPTDDVLSALVHARDADDRLSEDELLAACQAIIEAGIETTGHMLAICVDHVASDPNLRSRVMSSVDDALSVVDELLRFPGLVMGMTRIVKEPFEWHGKALQAGQIVFLMNGAGNVDPDVFDRPEIINPNRKNDASLSFGPGLHHCIGRSLARSELSEFLHAAFTRFHVSVVQEGRTYVNSYVIRGYNRLEVRFAPVREARLRQ